VLVQNNYRRRLKTSAEKARRCFILYPDMVKNTTQRVGVVISCGESSNSKIKKNISTSQYPQFPFAQKEEKEKKNF
jgi:hypothetical protein